MKMQRKVGLFLVTPGSNELLIPWASYIPLGSRRICARFRPAGVAGSPPVTLRIAVARNRSHRFGGTTATVIDDDRVLKIVRAVV